MKLLQMGIDGNNIYDLIKNMYQNFLCFGTLGLNHLRDFPTLLKPTRVYVMEMG